MVGAIFKIQHWPGAGFFLVIGITLLSAFYIPFVFIQRMIENKSVLNVIVNTFALFSLSLIFTGSLFKVQHWPGAGPMLIFGAFLLICPTMILYIVQQFKENGRRFGEYWKAIVLMVFVSIFFFAYALNYSRNILDTYVKIEEASIETNSNINSYNTFILEELSKQNDPLSYLTAKNIDEQTNGVVQHIEELKNQLIELTDRGNTGGATNHWNIQSKDNYDIPTSFLAREGSEEAEELITQLNSLRENILSEINKLPIKNKESVISDLGNLGISTEPDPNMTYREHGTWQEEMFYLTPLVGTLAVLTSIQTQVLNAEFKALTVISKNSLK